MKQKSVSVGLLLPTSTIFPISKTYERGVKDALNEQDIEAEFVKEMIGQGSTKDVDNACSNLLNYHEVDVITGIVSNFVLKNVAVKFESGQVPVIISNLGAHTPDISEMPASVFINSANLWQHAWALGDWGVKQIGPKGMYLSSVYDAGYSFSAMFYAGMQNADPDSSWSYSVTPMPPPKSVSDMSVLFPFMEEYEPDFVFATFCGTETTEFLNEFIKRDWHKRTAVLGLPYLLSPFKPVADELTVYTSALKDNDPTYDPAAVFYQLGYQAGQAIAAAFGNEDGNATGHLQQDASLLSVNNQSAGSVRYIGIIKNTIGTGPGIVERQITGTAWAGGLEHERLTGMLNQVATGWMNPYLCV